MVEDDFVANEKGWGLKRSTYDKLYDLIAAYDIKPEQDVRRGSAMGSKVTGDIGVGLSELNCYIEKQGKGVKKMLDNIMHPGSKDYTRNQKYEGRSFMQIIYMCVEGHECNNDLADALRECLGTLGE